MVVFLISNLRLCHEKWQLSYISRDGTSSNQVDTALVHKIILLFFIALSSNRYFAYFTPSDPLMF
jgi:hypothetical protein